MKKPPFNDWMTPIADKKLQAFAEKVREMAAMEFGVDQDNDPAVEVLILDRTRYEPTHWWLVPYGHKAKTAEQKQAVAEAVENNLDTAMSRFQLLRKMQQFDRSRAKP